jgi:alkylated DNA repair dioxygenase AlkB
MIDISVVGGELYLDEHFLPSEDATNLVHLLLANCEWVRRSTSFGPPVPRDEAYYGDPGTHYTYSRRNYTPTPWLPELLTLKTRVEAAIPAAAYTHLGLKRLGFNAVLCNLYRDGNDSVGLHADAEPEMGPIIASVSLGAERLFRLKRKDGSVAFAKALPNGSLLIMAGETQQNFKHEVPKQPRITTPRINLTFRHVHHDI